MFNVSNTNHFIQVRTHAELRLPPYSGDPARLRHVAVIALGNFWHWQPALFLFGLTLVLKCI